MPNPPQPWSLRVGSLFGIPIRVHLTFVLFLALIAWSQLSSVVMVLCIFAVIVVHELGHALVARRFGIHTRQIMLLPIGGVASLERIPEKPSQELAVALVGPAINLVIAAILAPFDHPFTRALMWINIGLAVFNLLPAFPMDGGRVTRALLAMRLGHLRATEIAATLGKVIALALAVLGVFTNWWLILIAIVVWMGARAEAQATRMRAAIVDVPVSVAMNRQIDVVRSDEEIGEAARLLVTTGQQQLPIVDEGETVGVLTRTDVARGLDHAGPRATISEAPHHTAITVGPSESLEGVFDRLSHEPDSIAVVVDRGVPVGIVTTDQLATDVALHGRAG
jgi:Zn-dependent protease/predicted transcriptional regulator